MVADVRIELTSNAYETSYLTRGVPAINLVRCEGFEPPRPKACVSKTHVSASSSQQRINSDESYVVSSRHAMFYFSAHCATW